MDENKTMSDQIEYEAVPESDLLDHQIFHANKAKHEDIEPWQGGVAAEVIGLPVAAGAKTASGFVKSKITKAAIDKLADTLTKKASVTVEAAPSDFAEKNLTTMASEPSRKVIGGSGTTNYGRVMSPDILPDVVAEKIEDMTKANPKGTAAYQIIDKDQAALNKIRNLGYGDYELQGQGKGQLMLQPNVQLPSVAAQTTPMVSPAEPLSPYQRAIQKIQNIPGTETMSRVMNNPFVKGAGVVGTLYGGGENAIRLFNHMKHDQVGRQYLDALGLISNVATLAPTPFSPWSNIAGAAGSGLTEWYQRKLEEEDKQNKAVGGLASLAVGGSVQHMAEGNQPDPIPIQKNNFLTEQAANKALVEIAKRKALYEIGQIAEQERAKQAASRARPNSLYPATGTLEPSGNGGPMLNNPLNR